MPNVVSAIKNLISLFEPHCDDRTTIAELQVMLQDTAKRQRGHDLFDRIRKKTLLAENGREERLIAQYLFEEVCAKTLYNLGHPPAPFDPDVPFRVVPSAFLFARATGLPDDEVVRAIMSWESTQRPTADSE
jgi:hypothetical protein